MLAAADQAADIINRAGQEGGYIAALFAFIVILGFGLLGWFIRQLWTNQREMQQFQQDTLIGLVQETQQLATKTNDLLHDVNNELASFRKTLDAAPCGNAVGDIIKQMVKEGQLRGPAPE